MFIGSGHVLGSGTSLICLKRILTVSFGTPLSKGNTAAHSTQLTFSTGSFCPKKVKVVEVSIPHISILIGVGMEQP